MMCGVPEEYVTEIDKEMWELGITPLGKLLEMYAGAVIVSNRKGEKVPPEVAQQFEEDVIAVVGEYLVMKIAKDILGHEIRKVYEK